MNSASVRPASSNVSAGAVDAPFLQVEHLTKRFGSTAVVDDVSLTVAKGEVVAIIGPSGAGKSTFIRCINYLEEPSEGAIYLDGQLVGDAGVGARPPHRRRVDHSALRRNVGMVFQSFNLFPHLRVDQNIMLGQVRALGRSKADALLRAQELLESVGLAHKIRAKPSQLSGGEAQRVAIARALALDPSVMLFDEPTSALDVEVRGEVLGVMQSLAQQGMTMIIVTHELRFAERVADHIVFMADGRICEQGPPSRILHEPHKDRTRQFLRAARE